MALASRSLYNKLKEVFNIQDDSDFGFFIEVDLLYPNTIEKQQKIFHFVLKKKLFLKIKIMII